MADITNCTNNTSTYANNTIPQLSSDDLNIQSWERMDHGGHSFVFKVSIDDGVSAIKIFRFQTRLPPTSHSHIHPSSKSPAERPEPYLYFRRESTSYRLLSAAQLTGTVTPRIYGILRISPTHEAYLLSEGKLKGLSRRREKEIVEKPLMAVWIEYICGRRLAMLDTKGEKGKELKRETESALERIHAAGVLQGDIKWRNIMVLDNNELEYRDASRERLGRIVWLDFSNAVTREEGIGEDLWGPKVNEETRRLRDMLDRHEPASPAAFEFEALGIN